MLTFALSLTLLLSTPALPAQGVLAPGKHLGGVELGDTQREVRARWGARFTRCSVCARPTWLYTYRSGNPAGAAVVFRAGRVSAVFTLGAPRGWRTSRGLRLRDPATRIEPLYGTLPWSRCAGYGALSIRRGAAVASIYTYGDSVYGFALTRPGDPVCQ